MSKWHSEREALLSAAQRMATGGLVAGASGNVSMLPGGATATTACCL